MYKCAKKAILWFSHLQRIHKILSSWKERKKHNRLSEPRFNYNKITKIFQVEHGNSKITIHTNTICSIIHKRKWKPSIDSIPNRFECVLQGKDMKNWNFQFNLYFSRQCQETRKNRAKGAVKWGKATRNTFHRGIFRMRKIGKIFLNDN